MSPTANAQAANGNGIGNGNSTPVSVLADNLMRRVLRINDPSSPVEVAAGLGRAYPLESTELEEEIQGLPIGPPPPATLPMAAPSMAGAEMVQAQNNIQTDLDFLTRSSQLKEVQVELQSWGETIGTWLADGAAGATQALDASARDRVFSARRILLDYARVSRLVGSLTPGLSIAYRRFARSLDEAAGILLVSLGESLAQGNFSGDRLLLQAPASELGARADAAAAALRNLTGSVQDAFSPSAWPWGLDSYRRLLSALENAGHGDIRVLLTENGLRAFTDELINRASSVNGNGLRALAATQVLALERVRRLIEVGAPIADNSPPMAAFISALELFVDTFRGGSAYRLIALGRPLLSSAGLYTFGGPDPGTQTLLSLVQWRSAVAQLNDILFGTDLTAADAQAQFAADTCLYSLDLAVDLYAVAADPQGQGEIEQRAAAYGLFMWQLLTQRSVAGGPVTQPGLASLLGDGGAAHPLLPPGTQLSDAAPLLAVPSIALLEYFITQAISGLGLSGGGQIYNVPQFPYPPNSLPSLVANTPAQRNRIARELEALRSRHTGFRELVNAVTPGNFDPRSAMQPMEQALSAALVLVGGTPARGLTVPPPVEAALARGVPITPFGPPQLNPLAPLSGPAGGGTPVTITGSGMEGASAVTFGPNAVTNFRVASNAQINATSPPGVPGVVNVQVVNAAGASATQPFTYVPQVTNISPNVGPTGGNTIVRVTGLGLTGATVAFVVGNTAVTAAPFAGVGTDTELYVVSPAAANAGPVNVRAQTAAGDVSPITAADQFTYLSQPTVEAVNPAEGPLAGGTPVMITGSGFVGVSGIRFGGAVVSQYVVVSPTEILATSPARRTARGATVQVVVTTSDGPSTPAAAGAANFTYT
jgi:hypothetical protein